jgi:hypothetical protein
MNRLRFLVAALAFLVAAAPPRVVRIDLFRVRAFAAPVGWELVPQSSYPRLLAAYVHPDGGKLTLAAQRVPAGIQPMALAEQSRAALTKQGFASLSIRKDGEHARLDAVLDGGKRFMRQVYVVDGDLGYVITLIAPVVAARVMSDDFDEAVRSLSIGPATAVPDGGAAR